MNTSHITDICLALSVSLKSQGSNLTQSVSHTHKHTTQIYPSRSAPTRNRERSQLRRMASAIARVSFRIIMAVLLLLVLFYVGRPLYWKVSATIHDIRNNKQTVKQGMQSLPLSILTSISPLSCLKRFVLVVLGPRSFPDRSGSPENRRMVPRRVGLGRRHDSSFTA
jgi:hypothetical protein